MHDCDAENIPPEDSHMQSPLYSPFVHRKSYSEITQRFADDDIPTLHDHDFFREVDSDDDCDDDLNHSIQSGDTSHEYDADTDYDEMKFSTSTPAAVPTNLSDSTIQKADVKLVTEKIANLKKLMVQNFNQIQYLRLKYANEKKKLEIINRNIHNLSHVSKVDDITDALRNLLFCDDEPESPKSEAFVNQTNGLTRGKAIKLNEAQQLLLQRYYIERERKMKTLKNLHMCCKQCNARTDQYEKALDYYNAELFWLQKMR